MSSFNEAFNRIKNNNYMFLEYDNKRKVKYEISLSYFKSINKKGKIIDIQDMTIEEAKDIYFEYLWLKAYFYEVESQNIANILLDMAIYFKIKLTIVFIQRAINNIFQEKVLEESGNNAKKSIEMINFLIEEGLEEDFVREYKDLQLRYYKEIMGSKNKNYLNIWYNRNF